MYYFSFNPPEVSVEVPNDFKGRILAFGYNTLEEEQVIPENGRPESIYNLTIQIFRDLYPDKTTEILSGSTLQNISDRLDTIDFLIVPRFNLQRGFFDSHRNYLIISSPEKTKYSDPTIITLNLEYTSYEEAKIFISKLADKMVRYETDLNPQ